MEGLANKDDLERLALLVKLELLETEETMVPKEIVVPVEGEVKRAKKDILVLLAELASQAEEAQREIQAALVEPVKKEIRESTVLQV